MKIVGVSACPIGIAHTYMSAETITEECKKRGYSIKMETQGAVGVENELSQKEIDEADIVLLAVAVEIGGMDRFKDKIVYTAEVSECVAHADQVIDKVETFYKENRNTEITIRQKSSAKEELKRMKDALMTGVSYMIPFVVAGGVLMAISFMGGTPTSSGYEITNSFMQMLNLISSAGFAMMVPALGGFVAYAIGGRPAIAPGFILGYIANNPIGDTAVKAGFLGALLMGILAGYFIKWMKSWKVPEAIKAIMPVLVIPTISVFALGVLYVYVINTPIVMFSEWLLVVLQGIMNKNIILFAIILGLICEIDMGGPICKAVTILCLALLAEGNYVCNAIFFVCPSVPPLAVLLSNYLFPKKWDKSDLNVAQSAGIMGLVGITEGTIPFIVKDALHILPGTMIGCAVASVIAALAGVTSPVPHGGFLPTFVVGHPLWYVAAQIAGVVVGALIIGLIRKPVNIKK